MDFKAMSTIVIASFILESIWQTLKIALDARHNTTSLATSIGTIIIGLFLAFDYNIDILAFMGLTDHIPYGGIILSGILISRGSNFIHDLLTRLSTFRETYAILAPIDKTPTTAPPVGINTNIPTIPEMPAPAPAVTAVPGATITTTTTNTITPTDQQADIEKQA